MKKNLDEAVLALKSGKLICYPTDTIYGIGADIKNDKAVENVYKIKNRPKKYPLSVAVSSIKDIEKIAYFDKKSKILAENFLPGPLCLILNKKNVVSDLITAGLDKVAVRIPNNNISNCLTNKFGPITCTSANIHGKPTPKVINNIYIQFKGEIEVYIDFGELSNKPSTIVDATQNKISFIRQGLISKEDIINVI